MRGVDYYELLGVDRAATRAEIKSAYRSLARTMHPDVGGTAGTFRLLREAYETLDDPVRRAEYDNNTRSDDQAHDDQVAGNRNGSVETSQRPTWRVRPRRPGGRRMRDFGDDPDFIPRLPRLSPDEIPWWDTVNPRERVRCLPPLGPKPGPTLALVSGWGSLLFAGLTIELTPVLYALWLSLLIGIGAVVMWLLHRHLGAYRSQRQFAAQYRGRKVFGQPEKDRDARPKQLTADLLAAYLTRLPGVRIFHGLAWPGSVFADVDHAVLCGRRLVLIESKGWLPGHYTADAEGTLWRNGHRFRGGASRLTEGIAAYADMLPGIDVRGALLIYPSRAGEITTEELPDIAADSDVREFPGEATRFVPPLTPVQFVGEIGRWLAEESAAVDRDAFTVLLEHLVAA